MEQWKQKFDELVAAVADDLAVVTGNPWWHEPGEGVFNYLTYGQQKVTVRKDGDRVRFTGRYPHLEKKTGGYEEFGLRYGEEHAVTCGMSRGSMAIAKDVARRFLPDYNRYWQRGLEERAEHQEQVAQVIRQAERLTEAWQIPVFPRHDDREATGRYGGSTDLRAIIKLQYYDGGRVSLDIHSLTVEEAAQVGLLLREMRQAERGELPVTDDGLCDEVYVSGNNGGDYLNVEVLCDDELRQGGNMIRLEVGNCCVKTIRAFVPVEFVTATLTKAILEHGSIREAIMALDWSDDFKEKLASQVVMLDCWDQPIDEEGL